MAVLTFCGFPLIKNFAAKLRHLRKHMKIDTKKTNKKRNNIMRQWVLLAQPQKRNEFHLRKRKQNSKRKFLKNNALRHPYQRLTE